jgi:chromosome segregation ATPase
VEYEKIHKALKKSHESETRLLAKCTELNADIVNNAAKVSSALKLSEDDQNTIAGLKAEIEKAWKMVDASHEKEARAKDSIQGLKLEIANLGSVVERGPDAMTAGMDQTVEELIAAKEALAAERDAQVDQIVSLRNEVAEMSERLRTAESSKQGLEDELGKLRDQVESKKLEGEREARKKERLDKELAELKTKLENKQHDIKAKTHTIKEAEEAAAKLEGMLKEQRGATERAKKEYGALNEKLQKLTTELEEQMRSNAQLVTENGTKRAELEARETELSGIKQDALRAGKIRDATVAKLQGVEKEKRETERDRDDLKRTIAELERQIEAERKQAEMEVKKQHELKRERDILTKLKSQAESATVEQRDLVKVNENTRKTLEQEIQGYKMEAQKQAKMIFKLEQEREKYGGEASDATARYLGALEEVKIREIAIIDLQKRISDGENRLKQQQNLYEATRTDRNTYSKNLLESQDEILEMKRKFKIMNHQIEQLKEEISAKDLAMVKEHFDYMKVEKEKETLRFELNKALQNIKEAESAISSQRAEMQKLNHVINEADQERARQKKEHDVVVNDRDVLGTQLIRRNDELALLYEKIKIQQSILNKGQIQYSGRLNELRVLKIKLGDLKRELAVLRNSVGDVDVLKREVHHLGRELLSERTKVKALSEELENPLNVHRWRKLEGSDPATFEMIQKIQTLQRRLIAKTEEVVEKDLLIQEKEKLYVELKTVLARQPGPEVAEQLSVYQQNLREKTRQMKGMASELNMYVTQTSEYKYEIDRLTRDLGDLKKRYYETKRREALERERAFEPEMTKTMSSYNNNPNQARFTGGGFGLSS